MADLTQYLREEIEEENELGYLSEAESARRVRLLDAEPSGQPSAAGDAGDAQATFDDGTVRGTWEEIDGLIAYFARPAAGGSAPGVVVVHENKGLTPYVQDVARRLAAAGFVALAPDLLSRVGGTASFADPAEVTAALGTLTPEDLLADLQAGVGYLADDDAVGGNAVGVLGFCFGGGMAWRLATRDQRLRAAIPFYGPNPPLEDVAKITAPVFAVYGALDERITGKLPEIEAAMNEHGKVFDKLVLTDAQHAFHNDTNPDRYHPQAAATAWSAALEHLNAWLRS